MVFLSFTFYPKILTNVFFFYLLQEEIDDIIVTAPVTVLDRTEETDVSRKQSQINCNIRNSNVSCPEDRSLVETKSLCNENSSTTLLFPRSENSGIRKSLDRPNDRFGKSVDNEESNETVRENLLIPIATIPRRKNAVDDRIIDYKELLSEFGLSDSECAESFEADKSPSHVRTNGDARLHEISVNHELASKSMKMGITASYVLNSDYEDPKDLIITREPIIQKIDHFPIKLDNGYAARSLENGKNYVDPYVEPQSSDYEEPYADSPETSTNLQSNDSLIIDLPNEISSLSINSERCGPTLRGRTSDCVVVSVLPKSNKILDVAKDCEMNDRTSVKCESDRRDREKKISDSCSSSTTNSLLDDGRTEKSKLMNDEAREESSKKWPPRQRQQEQRGKRANLPTSPMTQKRPRFLLHGKLTKSGLVRSENTGEPSDADYNDGFGSRSREFVTRSKSLENPSIPRSAPVTPTEDKRLPFSKILRKCHIPVFRESVSDAVLVRVSSLPDEDLLEIGSSLPSNEILIINEKIIAKDSSTTRNIGTVSPLTLRSDLTAKRLSESDKDVSQISPVELKKFTSVRRTSVNDAAVGCDIHDTSRCVVGDESKEIARSTEKFKQDDATAKGIRIDENNSRSGSVSNLSFIYFSHQHFQLKPQYCHGLESFIFLSIQLPISLQSLFSRLRNGSGSCCPSSLPTESFVYNDIATQTSPAMSRSSSFTWVSDCESPRGRNYVLS